MVIDTLESAVANGSRSINILTICVYDTLHLHELHMRQY